MSAAKAVSLEGHIAAKVMEWSRGQHQQVLKWLRSLGHEVVREEPGAWTVRSTTGMTVGLMPGKPCDVAPQFGFILGGPLWPHVWPGLLKAVDRAVKNQDANAH